MARTNVAGRAKAISGGIRLGRVAGIDVIADYSLLVIFALVTVSLGAGLLPRWHPTWSAALTWSVAFLAAVLFFVSVFLHELSHAIVGRMQGVRVRAIRLFIFGGVAQMESEPKRPLDELLMAGVGPLVSLAIGGLSLLVGGLLARTEVSVASGGDPTAVLKEVGPVATLLLWLGPVNLMLGLFNLVPGFPLDGGRVLRSILWAATGDLRRATRWAAGIGRGFGVLLMGLGISMLFGAVIPVLGGGSLSGLWMILIGWFLYNAARASYQQVLFRDVLSGVRVAAVMRSDIDTVPADLSVAELVEGCLMKPGVDTSAFPVVDGSGKLVGVVSIDHVRKLARDRWSQTSVGEIMAPASSLRPLASDDEASATMQAFAEQGPYVPVVDHGEIRGMVEQRDVMRYLMLHRDAPA